MAQWHSGTVAQWYCGTVAQWHEHRTLDSENPGIPSAYLYLMYPLYICVISVLFVICATCAYLCRIVKRSMITLWSDHRYKRRSAHYINFVLFPLFHACPCVPCVRVVPFVSFLRSLLVCTIGVHVTRCVILYFPLSGSYVPIPAICASFTLCVILSSPTSVLTLPYILLALSALRHLGATCPVCQLALAYLSRAVEPLGRSTMARQTTRPQDDPRCRFGSTCESISDYIALGKTRSL